MLIVKRFLLALALLFAFTPVVQADLVFGPYLQSLEPGSCLICAYVENGDSFSVRLEEPDGESFTVEAAGQEPACAELSHLRADEVYFYEGYVNGQQITGAEPISFVPYPVKDITMVVYGDTRSGEYSFDLSHRTVVQAITQTVVPDLIVHTGDFVERGGDAGLWKNFFQLESSLLMRAPIMPSIGRSDQPPDLMESIFPRLKKTPWYSFDRGDMHVVVLKLWRARSQSAAETEPDGEQMSWLREDLTAARARGVRYLFVVLHEPIFDLQGKNTRTAREILLPMFAAQKVTAVFSGAHYFSHKVWEGVHYFTNGGGGALLVQDEPKDGVFRFYRAVHHFIVLEMDDFGARLRAVDVHGDEFYELKLDEAAFLPEGPAKPVSVRTYGGGIRTVSLDLFYQPELVERSQLESLLDAAAKEIDVTLAVTFRTLDNEENRDRLESLNLEGDSPAVALLGDYLLVGLDSIGNDLPTAIKLALASKEENGASHLRWLLAGGAVLAAGLLFLLFFWRHRRKRQFTK